MSDSVISVENLGKRYRIRHQQQGGVGYKALRDVLADTTKSVGKRLWSIISAFQRFSVSAFSNSPVVSSPLAHSCFLLFRLSTRQAGGTHCPTLENTPTTDALPSGL